MTGVTVANQKTPVHDKSTKDVSTNTMRSRIVFTKFNSADAATNTARRNDPYNAPTQPTGNTATPVQGICQVDMGCQASHSEQAASTRISGGPSHGSGNLSPDAHGQCSGINACQGHHTHQVACEESNPPKSAAGISCIARRPSTWCAVARRATADKEGAIDDNTGGQEVCSNSSAQTCSPDTTHVQNRIKGGRHRQPEGVRPPSDERRASHQVQDHQNKSVRTTKAGSHASPQTTRSSKYDGFSK